MAPCVRRETSVVALIALNLSDEQLNLLDCTQSRIVVVRLLGRYRHFYFLEEVTLLAHEVMSKLRKGPGTRMNRKATFATPAPVFIHGAAHVPYMVRILQRTPQVVQHCSFYRIRASALCFDAAVMPGWQKTAH